MMDTGSFVVGCVAVVLLLARLLFMGRPTPRPTPAVKPAVKPASPASARSGATQAPAPPPPPQVVFDEESAVRRAFNNVFSMVAMPRRDALIVSCMRANGCSRLQAMKILLTQRGVDEVKWD